MIALALALAITPVPPTDGSEPSVGDTEFCDGARIAVESLRATYPRQVDAVTRIQNVSLDCPARTMEWTGSISLKPAQMPGGWMAERQSAWNATTCKGAVLQAARLGWHFRQTYRFEDGSLSSIDAACP